MSGTISHDEGNDSVAQNLRKVLRRISYRKSGEARGWTGKPQIASRLWYFGWRQITEQQMLNAECNRNLHGPTAEPSKDGSNHVRSNWQVD